MSKKRYLQMLIVLLILASLPGCVNFNEPPEAVIQAFPLIGVAPLKVVFSGVNSIDPDGDLLHYEWDFGDGKTAVGSVTSHTYENLGRYTATLTVSDAKGARDSEQVIITVITEVLGFETIDRGVSSGIKAEEELAVRTMAEWRTLWAKHVSNVSPQPLLPEVDFSQEMVIAVFLGQRPTSGYWATSDNISIELSTVEVSYTELQPGPGCGTIQINTAPFHIVRTERVDLPVHFTKAEVVHTCSP